jgi:hypothetical protein
VTPPAAAAAGRVAPRRVPYPARPRRVSGPAVPTRPRRSAAPPAPAAGGLVLGLAGALGALSRHRLVDRLIAGKAWIAVLAFALIGIVTLQLGLLELNRGIGRTLERQGLLERENAALSIENSEMAAGNRVESRAQQLGMEIVPSSSLRFLPGHGDDVAKAAAALNTSVHTVTAGSGAATASATTSAGGASSAEPAASGTSNASSSTSNSASEAPATGTGSEPAASTAETSTTTSAPPAATTSGSEGGTAPPSETASTTTSAGGAQASPSG